MSSFDFLTVPSLDVWVQAWMHLADFLFVNLCLFHSSIVVIASTDWRGPWLRGSIPRTDSPYICVGSTPFYVVTARRDTRPRSRRRVWRVNSLSSGVAPCSTRFVFSASQSVLEILLQSGERVSHVGVESAQIVVAMVDGWPRGVGSVHFPGATCQSCRYESSCGSPPLATILSFFVFMRTSTVSSFIS